MQIRAGLTKRAPDVWDSAAFSSIFLASVFFCSQTESTPTHTQVTQTIVNSAPEMIVRSWQERLALWQRLAIVRLVGMRKMGEVLSQRLFVKPEEETLRQTFVERWAENDKRAYLDSLRALVGWSVTAQLETIRCPTLVLAAEYDYTPVAVKEAYVAKLPDAQLVVIPDAHHALPVEKPRAFNQALQEFLARHP